MRAVQRIHPLATPSTVIKALLAAMAITLSISSVACSSSDSNTNNSTAIDCSKGTTPKFSELTGLSKCTSCHSTALSGAARSDSPIDVNFDKYSEAKLSAHDALSELEEGAMPPEGEPKLTAEEADAIKRWASCGTPE